MRSDIVPGATFPDYALPDQDRVTRRLSEIQGDDPLILTLARGHYCPKEHQQHLELAAFYPKIAVSYTKIATISTDEHHTSQEFRASVGAQWPFLEDPGRIVQQCDIGLVAVRVDGPRLAFAAPPLLRSGSVSAEDLGELGVLENETIGAIAKAHDVTPAQAILRWHLQVGNVVIPKSVTPSRIEENFDLFGFELTDDEVARITTLDRGERTGPDPDRFNPGS